jgi:hypothetical protein
MLILAHTDFLQIPDLLVAKNRRGLHWQIVEGALIEPGLRGSALLAGPIVLGKGTVAP